MCKNINNEKIYVIKIIIACKAGVIFMGNLLIVQKELFFFKLRSKSKVITQKLQQQKMSVV